MRQFRVELTVDVWAESPEDAAQLVVEMANGWSYVVTDFADNSKVFVHLDNDETPIVEPYTEAFDRDPYETYGTPEHESLLIEEERGR